MRNEIVPQCTSGEIPYITFEGRWLPCCACRDPFWHPKDDYYHEVFSSDNFLITKNDIETIPQDSLFLEWITSIKKDYDSAPDACKKRCSKFSNVTEETSRSKNKWYSFENKFDVFLFAQEHNLDADEIY